MHLSQSERLHFFQASQVTFYLFYACKSFRKACYIYIQRKREHKCGLKTFKISCKKTNELILNPLRFLSHIRSHLC